MKVCSIRQILLLSLKFNYCGLICYALYSSEIKKIHLRAQEHIQKIFNDHDKTKMKIENERRVLELQTIELQKREVVD